MIKRKIFSIFFCLIILANIICVSLAIAATEGSDDIIYLGKNKLTQTKIQTISDDVIYLSKTTAVALANSAPALGTVIPNSGQSVVDTEQAFTTNYSDANGYSDLNYVMFLIDDNNDGVNAVYLRYVRASNLIYLANGAGVWESSRTCTPGQNKVIENTFGRLNCLKTSVSNSGNTITVNWRVVFKNASIGKNFNLYLYAKDNAGLRAGFLDKGDWKVVSSVNLPPSVDSVNPNSGQSVVNTEQMFTTKYSDANGYSDLNYVMFLIDDNNDGVNAVYLKYVRASNLVYLADDSGNWISTLTCTPGQNKVIQNSYGSVNCSKIIVSMSGNSISVNWPVVLKSNLTGKNLNLYLYAKDNIGLRVGWVDMGNWGVVNVVNNFVKVNGSNFYLNGKPFYFAGANAYYAWYGNWDCVSYDKNQGCSKEVLDDTKIMNLNVLRVWGFSDGTSNYWGQLQPQKGVYDENGFKKFDRLIKEAGDRNIKLIIPLVNNWNDFGGMNQYNNWCSVSNHDDFYTNSCTKLAYKNYVAYVLNRTNTLTGVKYKDDPTIMAWELANEPRAESDASGNLVDNWIEEMSNYIKSIDNNHLVSVGEEGWNDKGTSFTRNHNHAKIDFMAFHLLVNNWGFSEQQSIDWINSHIDEAKNLGKPVILEEIGIMQPRDSYFSSVYGWLEARNINGNLFWMLKDKNYPDFDSYGINYPEDFVTNRIIENANCMNKKSNGLSCGNVNSINWLKKQQDIYSGGLVDSYDGDGTDYAYTYDQAVAAISFVEAGETARAKKVLDRMKAVQGVNGGWLDCYKASNYAVCNSGQDEYSTGPIAWMVIAVNYYEFKTQDSQYNDVAIKALQFLDTLRNTNPADERYGSVRFCSGNSCTIPNAISTEHNLDAYSAYYWRGVLLNDNVLKDKASLIKNYLITEMWAPSPTSNGPYHNVNVFWTGFNDFSWCSDPQTWSVLSLGKTGPNGEEFYKSLEWLYYNAYGSTRNKQNYSNSIILVDGFKSCTSNPNYIWLEGTGEAASAFYFINDNRGDYFYNEIKRIPSYNEGVVYSFSENNPGTIIYPENYRYGSVASSSWYYFSQKKINPMKPGNDSTIQNYYNVTKVNVGNTIEYRCYYKQQHFMTVIIDSNGGVAIRPHPGLDVNGWGSSLYMQPFLPGATLRGTQIKNISSDANGIKVNATGLVSQGTSGSYGIWNGNFSFSYSPSLKEINGNGKYNINLNGVLSSSTGDLNLYKLASNYLDNVPLLNGSNGDTGDMKYASVTGNPFDFIWNPSLQPAHFPGDIRNPISIEAIGDYNQVDTVAQGYEPIAAAYKPSMKVVLTCQQSAPIIFGGIYNTSESKQFWSDNVGITPLVLKSSTYITYNFDVSFNSKAIAGDH